MQAKNNSPAAQKKCITGLILYHFGVNLPVMIISYPLLKRMGMEISLPLPSWYFMNSFSDLVIIIIIVIIVYRHFGVTWQKAIDMNISNIFFVSKHENILFLVLQENHFNPNNLLLHIGGFCILLGTQDTAYKMVVHKCAQCSPWVSSLHILVLIFICSIQGFAHSSKRFFFFPCCEDMLHHLDLLLNMLILLRYFSLDLLPLLVLFSLVLT